MGSPVPTEPTMESITKSRFHENGEVTVGGYNAWLKKHPSALDAFEKMMQLAEGKDLAVFLDYDGTLSPIVKDPHKAFMSDQMRLAVEKVAHIFPTAIISGRRREKVEEFVRLKNVTYAGSHGMDILTSGSLSGLKHQIREVIDEKGTEVTVYQPAKDFFPLTQELLKVLEEKTEIFKGCLVEDNLFCVSVHYRCVNPEEVGSLQQMVKSTMKEYPEFCIKEGKMVMEIRPNIDWDKGRALQYIIESFGFNGSDHFLPLYIGDDKTDEDAFKVIKDMGRGYSIVVSSIPKETQAAYSLRNPDEVMNFLTLLAKWGRKRNSSP